MIDFKKIRHVSAIIRNDSDNLFSDLQAFDTISGGLAGGPRDISATSIGLERKTGGSFDDLNYDATSFNRGWVIVQYEV